MRVGPLAALCTSRSTGPITFTVTPSIGAPLLSVMNNWAVVVAPVVARGFAGGFAGTVVFGGGAGGCAGVPGVCAKVNNRRATIDLRCYYGRRHRRPMPPISAWRLSQLAFEVHPAQVLRVVCAVGPVVPLSLDLVL